MGTEKRERQKANRRQRQMEEIRAERSSKVKRSALRWTAAVIAAVGAVILIAWVGGAFDGGDDGEQDQAEITLPPIDTTPAETFPTPPKPEVSIPEVVPTDLVITELRGGDGPVAEEGDTVLVHYVGVLSEDGTEFDNSYDRGTPFPVQNVGSAAVIQGWNEGLIGAQEGSQIQLDIPADLAYGDTGSGAIIQPGDAISFVIDVLSVTQDDGT